MILHVERKHKTEKQSRIDLGLALLSILRRPNERLTSNDIAAWCGCTPQAIRQIEARALRKLRNRIAKFMKRNEFGNQEARNFMKTHTTTLSRPND